jgi:ABC-type sugar transport systems, permease components
MDHKAKRSIYTSRRNFILFLFVLPALVAYTLFFVLPIAGDLIFSFLEWDGVSDRMKLIGLGNYKRLFFEDSLFYKALSHNLIYTVVVVIIQLSLALLFSLFLYKKIKGHNFFKTVFLLPVILSNITLGLTWSYMYDPMMGFVNYFFKAIGLGFLQQIWLGNQNIALFSVAFVNIWQYVGYCMVIYIAGLQTIPDSLYEACRIDGAGIWDTFRKITLPLLAPAMTINVVFSTIGCFKVFELIIVMTEGGPNNATQVLATLSYKNGFSYGEMGYASAMSMTLFLIIAIIGFAQTRILRSKEIKY